MDFLKNAISYADVMLKLGIHNVGYVAWCRFSIKTGIRKRFFLQRDFGESGPFFDPVMSKTEYPEKWKSDLLKDAGKRLAGEFVKWIEG